MLLGGLSQVKHSRLHQLVDWCGGSAEFDGCLVFDECHKAKHFVPVGYSYHHHLKLWPFSKQIWKIVTLIFVVQAWQTYIYGWGSPHPPVLE